LTLVRLAVQTVAALSVVASAVAAQDTTQAYPWRLSYFPYVTASPNDGLMPMARVVWFQASRWDARTSIDRQVAVEGGYSTKDAWLVRVQGDFPRMASGWRLQAIGEAARLPNYIVGSAVANRATRELAGVDITRTLSRHWLLALRGEAMHVEIPVVDGNPGGAIIKETDIRDRLAVIDDHRNREYDTRSGYLFQAGVLGGSAGTGYGGMYLTAGIWIPVNDKTRALIRGGFRFFEETTIDAARIIPAWENEFVAGGGPESNRALPIGTGASRRVEFASVELRRDLFVFAGGAVAALAFVDQSRVGGGDPAMPIASYLGVSSTNSPTGNTVGVGGGIAIRLLRNAVLTATVGVAHGDARVYVSSGWSW
jgi:hypothetical protein